MAKRSSYIVLVLSIIVLTSFVIAAQPVQEQRNDGGRTSVDAARTRTILDQYCVTCHNAKLKTANLLLDQLDVEHLPAHGEIAEKVIRKLRAGMMPPSGMRRPDQATLEAMVQWME